MAEPVVSMDVPTYWMRWYVFAAVWLPVYGYVTYVAVKWGFVAAVKHLQHLETLKAIGGNAMR